MTRTKQKFADFCLSKHRLPNMPPGNHCQMVSLDKQLEVHHLEGFWHLPDKRLKCIEHDWKTGWNIMETFCCEVLQGKRRIRQGRLAEVRESDGKLRESDAHHGKFVRSILERLVPLDLLDLSRNFDTRRCLWRCAKYLMDNEDNEGHIMTHRDTDTWICYPFARHVDLIWISHSLLGEQSFWPNILASAFSGVQPIYALYIQLQVWAVVDGSSPERGQNHSDGGLLHPASCCLHFFWYMYQ